MTLATGTPSLLNFPAEIHLLLLEQLDPVSSTCLGLTCKKLYAYHRTLHGTVSLNTPSPEPCVNYYPLRESPWGRIQLWKLLKNWFPLGWSYDWRTGKYLDLEGWSQRSPYYRSVVERTSK